jgi:hypothetical protein
MEKPFFSYELLRVAPDGSYRAFSGSERIAAFSDHLEIGQTRISYAQIVAFEAAGNLIRVSYVADDGHHVEQHFRYDTFLPGTATRRINLLMTGVAQILQTIRPPTAIPLAVPGTSPLPVQVRYAECPSSLNGGTQVRVFSPRVSFPALCPVCAGPPSTVGSLCVGVGFESGRWLVPTCAAHTDLRRSLNVMNWMPRATELLFSIANPTYADAFLKLNSRPHEERSNLEWERPLLAADLAQGQRFVIYNYALSFIYFTLLRTTTPRKLPAGSSLLLPGLPYSLLSVIGGWWAIPWGPVFVIQALATNFRRGMDVTGPVKSNLSGSPSPAWASRGPF